MSTPTRTHTEIPPTFQLQTWQIRLRELREPEPGEAPSELLPRWMPKACGGDGTIPENLGRELTFPECELIHTAYLDKSLLPHEAALLLGVSGSTIAEFLQEMVDEDFGLSMPPCPGWVPEWARTAPRKGTKPSWNQTELQQLLYYWRLSLFTPTTIAKYLGKPLEETQNAADWMGLVPKSGETPWDCPDWRFELDTPTDPKHLGSRLQHQVAEASATRFALLYEKRHILDENPEENDREIRATNRELDSIMVLHQRIFEKYINSRSKKYSQYAQNPTHTVAELKAAAVSALFERLRRWHPSRKINFSRRTVDTAINREMIAHLESQRLIALPDKIRSTARKLKAAKDNGTLKEEMDRLIEESGERCVNEAAKHQHNYAYIPTIALVDVYPDQDSEDGGSGCLAFTAAGKDNFQTFHDADDHSADILELLVEAAGRLNEFEKRAVLAYYGFSPDGAPLGHTKTLEEIGEDEGVTKERIRQRIGKGVERMRKYLATKDIRSVEDALAI